MVSSNLVRGVTFPGVFAGLRPLARVRRLISHRTIEGDSIAADQARLAAGVPQVDGLRARLRLAWLRHRPEEQTGGSFAVIRDQGASFDRSLVQRILDAYRKAAETELGARDSFWLQEFFELKRPVHDALLRGDPDEVGEILANPQRTSLLYGFDGIHADEVRTEGSDLFTLQWTYDNLVRAAEGVGARRLPNPEARGAVDVPDTEEILTLLDEACGFRIDFPNPFTGEVGLLTSRGVASYRAVQALFQAFRIRDLCSDRAAPRVLEIGGGLGRTAYYARAFGIRDYTIIDLPITGVAQAYFLGSVLGPESVQLYGEMARRDVRILPPTSFLEGDEYFDLALNVDSLTELSPDTARRYLAQVERRASIFLSINHEANPSTVRNLYTERGWRGVTRTPYWLRRGYVEEVVRF